MSVPCGGKCGDPACAKSFPSEKSLAGHIYGMRAKGVSKKPSEAVAAEPAGTFYPSLEEWTSKPPSQPTGAVPPPTSVGPAQPVSVPVRMDTSFLWLAAGNLIDDTLLKDKPRKINMTPEKAKALDASIVAFPFQVTGPSQPIPVPWYVPFLVVFIPTFVLPVLPEVIVLIKKGLEDAKKRREALREARPPSRETRGAEPAPEKPEPQPYRAPASD